MKKFLLIGQAVKPQGVRGEIKVLPATDDVERFCDLENVFLDEKGEICKKVESARTREGFAYVKLEGVLQPLYRPRARRAAAGGEILYLRSDRHEGTG